MHCIQQEFTVRYRFPVIFTQDVFAIDNPVLADVLCQGGHPHNKILLVLDSEVARLHPDLPDAIHCYAQAHQPLMTLVAPPFVVRGGEICKHDPQEVAQIHALVERYKIDRHAYILAIGGGAVLDAVGYAAATAHRGVRLIRLPSTVLAQNDAGIGVKNGVNAFGKKNFLGSFAPPFAVINDRDFLATLPARSLRAGMAEAVKVALIRDARFFAALDAQRDALARFAPDAMQMMIEHCARLHLAHIAEAGDPFEQGSSRPLDFGHWAAHKLEELSHSQLSHGEAVAIGIALDTLYSAAQGLLPGKDAERVIALLTALGFALDHPALQALDVDTALADFREHLGGELSIPLLAGIGHKQEAHAIEVNTMQRCIAQLHARFGAPVPALSSCLAHSV